MIPPFNTLEPLAGHPELREVNGTWMLEAQYIEEKWHVVREYRTDDGKPGRYWACSIKGIQDYGQKLRERKEERRSSWQARRDAEDEYSDSITELIEQRDKEGSEQ
jgi:hypothetical protein